MRNQIEVNRSSLDSKLLGSSVILIWTFHHTHCVHNEKQWGTLTLLINKLPKYYYMIYAIYSTV